MGGQRLRHGLQHHRSEGAAKGQRHAGKLGGGLPAVYGDPERYQEGHGQEDPDFRARQDEDGEAQGDVRMRYVTDKMNFILSVSKRRTRELMTQINMGCSYFSYTFVLQSLMLNFS